MLGFRGTFSVNFEIPYYWGIGKSVSRGFGTVKRIKEKHKIATDKHLLETYCMTKDEIVKYWIDSSEVDFQAMESLYDNYNGS